MMCLYQGPDRQGVEPLHIAAATAIIPPVPFDHGKWITVPGLAVDRHHICMTREDHRAFFPRAGMRKKRVLGLIGVNIAV